MKLAHKLIEMNIDRNTKAKDAYEARLKEIKKHLKTLESVVKKMEKETKPDWSHVGTAGAIAERLESTINQHG